MSSVQSSFEEYLNAAQDPLARKRAWIMTINNYSDNDITALRTHQKIKYAIWGKEKAPTTGTPHLQVFVVFKNAVRRSTLSAAWPRARVAIAMAKDPMDNINYCSKEGDFEERGQRPIADAHIRGILYSLDALFYHVSPDMDIQDMRARILDIRDEVIDLTIPSEDEYESVDITPL